jgi:hypothetical protein
MIPGNRTGHAWPRSVRHGKLSDALGGHKQFLYVSDPLRAIGGFSINQTTGGLTPLLGSPFSTGTVSVPEGLASPTGSDLLYAADVARVDGVDRKFSRHTGSYFGISSHLRNQPLSRNRSFRQTPVLGSPFPASAATLPAVVQPPHRSPLVIPLLTPPSIPSAFRSKTSAPAESKVLAP